MPARSIVTEVWGEPEFVDLPLLAKMLFVRLVTGDDVGSAGATRSPAKRLAGDLEGHGEDIAASAVEEALNALAEDGFVRLYEPGWIWLPRFIKHQAHSIPMLRGAVRQTDAMPDALRADVVAAVRERAATLGYDWSKIDTRDPRRSRGNAKGRTKGRTKGSPKGSGKGSPKGSPKGRGKGLARAALRGQGQDPRSSTLGSGPSVENAEPPADPDGPAAQAGSNGAGPELRACKVCDGPHLGPGSICDACLESDEVRV